MSHLLQPGDSAWTYECSWCGRKVREEDLTETLDGSELCPSCIQHYDADQDADDGDVQVFVSNLTD